MSYTSLNRSEAVAASSGLALHKNDISISYHRSHAHFLAKGGSPKKLFAELHGFEEGCSKGIGGSMHLVDLKIIFTEVQQLYQILFQ